MCDKIVSKDPFMLKYCLDRLHNAVFSNHDIVFVNDNSDNVTFF